VFELGAKVLDFSNEADRILWVEKFRQLDLAQIRNLELGFEEAKKIKQVYYRWRSEHIDLHYDTSLFPNVDLAPESTVHHKYEKIFKVIIGPNLNSLVTISKLEGSIWIHKVILWSMSELKPIRT
jgi:hypothetical protein